MSATVTSSIPVTAVGDFKVNTSLMATKNCNVLSKRTVSYIVLHYTGNKGPDTAKANANYFKNTTVRASAHYTVDDNNIYQCVAAKNTAWHCGTSGTYYSNCRNATSIGIEMCCTAGNYTISDATIENAAQLTAALCKKLNITAANVQTYVIRHYDVTRKKCPAQMAGSNNKEWTAFLARVKAILNGESSTSTTDSTVGTTAVPYTVKVSITDLNIRKGPGTNYAKTGKCTGKGSFTIVEESTGKGATKGWGLLKAYQTGRNGWISLDYATKT